MGGIIIAIIFIIVMCKIWGADDFLHDTGKGCFITIAIVVGGILLLTLLPDDSTKLDNTIDIIMTSICVGIGVFLVGSIIKKLVNINSDSQSSLEEREIAEPPSKSQQISSNLQNTLQCLDDLIGLETVKQQVHTLIKFIQVQQQREKHQLKTTPISYHCVFSGSPGTGKTTVARILAQIYKDLGVLKKGHLIETDRAGLVGEYVGQTAVKTNKVINSAVGGVLFIDEAYSLYSESAEDYGREAIATLLKRMEDERDNLVVVMAGYTEEMKQFIDLNPGLRSRFNRYIDFTDYSPSELFQIFKRYTEKGDFKLTSEAENAFRSLFINAYTNRDRTFGNARFVRNIFEKTIERQSLRVADITEPTVEQLTEITENDVPKL